MASTAATDGASSIQVAVRVRPFTIREAAQLTRTDDGPLFLGDGSLAAAPTPKLGQKGIRSVIKVVDDKCLVFDPPENNPVQRFSRSVIPVGKRVKDQTFGFDRVFDDNTSQGDVYEATTKSLLASVLDGYNATVFAYGATGCGKTHTITGTAQQPGIIFLTMQDLFERVEELQAEKETEITLSYLEIYNETIRDLLNPGAGGRQGLMLREDANQAVSVAGLSSHKPQNVQEVMDMVIRGNSNRTQSPTEANATSSRSHAVLQVNISLKDRNASVHEPVTMATLSIIDLAGSERASATKNRGERLLEGANINKSLLALGSCINALCDPRKKNHVPYRNSKLTRLLKFSLGGNCKTVMIVCVSPSSQHFDETQNTLRYANRAKNIQTKSVRNVYNVDRHVKDYLKKIDEQMNRINELTAQQKQYEELAFVKFRKAESKRAEIAHEGVVRIRAAYDHSADERRERVTNMRRLRQIERRIGVISAWVGAFDQVCETREEEEPPASLGGMRRTAQGILVELESSRQHYHQRLGKSNWTRAIDTALQDGLRQLQALEGSVPDSSEEISLRKEVEILKGQADIEAHLSVLEQEKVSEGGLMQILLSAHFETVAILNQLLRMTEEEAVQAGKDVLGKLMQSCTAATGQVIKPDGGLTIVDPVPTTATRMGTPRKRKPVPLMGPSPIKAKTRAFLASSAALPPHMTASSSPVPSPRRRVKLGGSKKGVSFAGTPRKKSPSKKRSVRWRDDMEGGAPLADFQPTPQKFDSSPVAPTAGSPPKEKKLATGTGRFAEGFLSKKPADGVASDGDGSSPLREIGSNSMPRLTPCVPTEGSLENYKENDNSSWSSDNERPSQQQLRTALKVKKRPSTAVVMVGSQASRVHNNPHRRRSPTASHLPKPAPPPIFSASHARRMVRSEKDDGFRSVLSPKTAAAAVGKVQPATAAAGLRRSVLGPAAVERRVGSGNVKRAWR
ncbi:kinesin-domain-containing protein [Piedraia hortae CBS 480.64]|uniref:Kinesin-like protein n=1 Tax=Piedraia hortae CBS 480.64 TaxID=1314780 RepID=A0A6A7BVA4_9PEZI|nr:kinesin-domain-containing protein [Piedraia hortae CBS 480.64]